MRLLEKRLLASSRFRGPDFYVVHVTDIIERPEPDKSPFEGHLVGNHDGGEHVLEEDLHSAFIQIAHDADFAPFLQAPIGPGGAEIRNGSPVRFIDHENLMGVVVSSLGHVDIKEVGGILKTKEKAKVPMGVAGGIGGILMFGHVFSDGNAAHPGLLDIRIQNETAKGEALDERYIER